MMSPGYRPKGNPRVTPITSYKTTDGKTFDSRDKATAHQNRLDREVAVLKVVEEFQFYSMGASDIAAGIVEHRDALLKALRS
jgi:hypothetical protein